MQNGGHSGMQGISPDRLDMALRESAAYRDLSPAAKQDLSASMAKVFGYLAETHPDDRPQTHPHAPARPFAPDLNSLRGPGGAPGGAPGGGAPAGGYPPQGVGQPVPGQPPAVPSAEGDRQNAFDEAASATSQMLGAIGFPDFVASLIQGTFQAIVDSSIQQMEAYSNLLAETAKTVDTFMADNITEDMARDHLADNYGEVFMRDLSTGAPELKVDTQSVMPGGLPSFLSNLGFDSPADINQQSVDQVVIPETRRRLAEMRHQSLATMVMMGINRIVVSDGEINAKLMFHIDANQSMSMSFSDYKPTSWTMAGQLAQGSSIGASGLLVNTTSLNAQTGVNMNTDLTGEVRVRFKSDYFPLERFADSAAIQLINNNAKVPQPAATPAPAGQPATGVPGAGGAPAPGIAPPPIPDGLAPPPLPETPGAVAAPPLPGAEPAQAAIQQSYRPGPYSGGRG